MRYEDAFVSLDEEARLVARLESLPLAPGVSLVTSHDPNDQASPRTRRHLPRFQAAAPPDPGRDQWAGWEALLADDGFDPAVGVAETLCVPPRGGFGTVCSSLLALGGRTTDPYLAEQMLDVWLNTKFAGGRHARRVSKIEPGGAAS